MISLAEMCKQARKAMRLDQKQFAKLIGGAESLPHYIEHGYVPEDNTIVDLIKALYGRWCR
jgi:transcriptional regulator with XRE-family HTH domain